MEFSESLDRMLAVNICIINHPINTPRRGCESYTLQAVLNTNLPYCAMR